MGYVAISTLIGSWPQDEEVILAGQRWVEDNPTHQQAYHVLAPLVAARPADDQVVGIALEVGGRQPDAPAGLRID